MKIDLRKEDLMQMADTVFEIDGNATFCNENYDSSIGVKEIFIRNILKLFGEQYNITSVEDYGEDSTIIKTNLPWEEIKKLNK